MKDFLLLRATLFFLLLASAWYLKPFGLEGPLAAGAGAVFCAVIFLFEHRIREITLLLRANYRCCIAGEGAGPYPQNAGNHRVPDECARKQSARGNPEVSRKCSPAANFSSTRNRTTPGNRVRGCAATFGFCKSWPRSVRGAADR